MNTRTSSRESIDRRIREQQQLRQEHSTDRCNRPDIRVACILDIFSYSCFKYECTLEQLHAETWAAQMRLFMPDFLLVESAWRGLDDSWRKQLCAIQKRPESPIWDLIEYCKQENIPTVFWNKEDSPHYSTFIETAKLFDYVFTTDINCVNRYKHDLGHKRIHVLPFAAQPMIHNPLNSSYRSKENISFAGTWHNSRYPKRQADMTMLLSQSLQYTLHIFDRNFYAGKDRFKFPKKYRPHIMGYLSYEEMVEAYKLYRVFLNVNSVTNSTTMFSRRVFEILASGTNVISTYSRGIEKMFNGIVPITRSEKETKAYLSKLLTKDLYSRKKSLLGVRKVNKEHLYEHRFNVILKQLGYPSIPSKGVSVIVYIDQEKQMDAILESFENQIWGKKELIVITKEEIVIEAALARWHDKSNIMIIAFKKEASFKDCLQYCVSQSKYDFISFFHDKDYYGPHFLTDLMHAFQYTDAHIVGKCAYYRHSDWNNLLLLCSYQEEYKYVNFVQGSSMVMKKELFSQEQISELTEEGYTVFMNNCRERGIKIYAADPFNYMKRSKSADRKRAGEEINFADTDEVVAFRGDYIKYVTV